MNKHDISLMIKLYHSLRSYRNTVTSVTIAPMGYSYGRHNYNIRTTIKSLKIEGYSMNCSAMRKWFNGDESYLKKYDDDRILKVVRDYRLTFYESRFSGHEAWPCYDMYEYLTKASTIYNFLKHFPFFKNIKFEMLDYEGNIISDSYMYDLHDKYDREKSKEIIKASEEIIEAKKKEVLKIIRDSNNHDGAFHEHGYHNIQVFIDKCDNAYDRTIIGKIRSGTSLSRKEVDRYDEFKDTYKEFIKLKSATSYVTELIEDISNIS